VGYYVHWQLSFSGSTNDDVVKKAAALAIIRIPPRKEGRCVEAENALRWFSTDKPVFGGYKGDLMVCGGVGNYTQANEIIEDLWWFFEELYRTGGLFRNHDRVILFVEPEQSESVEIHVIENPSDDKIELSHRKHSSNGEWAWGQY